jgi:uncharacterized protein YndB with AHSA1/START domain
MTERSVTHSTFTLERSYDASPERVFAAWAESSAKTAWFPAGEDHALDFRVGGRESSSGEIQGKPFTFDALYQDIVPNERIIYSYEMVIDNARLSVSLATIELKPTGGGTRLVLTEQGAFLDGLDDPAQREGGTKMLLDALGEHLAAQPANN